MGYSIKYQDSDKLRLEAVTSDIMSDLKAIEDVVIERMQPRLKDITIEELRKIKRIKSIRPHKFTANGKKRRTKHLYQDVQIQDTKDEFGYRVLKARGGRQTGTLWHLVNDGTYKTQATHFMDRIIARVGKEMDAVIDRELERRSEE